MISYSKKCLLGWSLIGRLFDDKDIVGRRWLVEVEDRRFKGDHIYVVADVKLRRVQDGRDGDGVVAALLQQVSGKLETDASIKIRNGKLWRQNFWPLWRLQFREKDVPRDTGRHVLPPDGDRRHVLDHFEVWRHEFEAGRDVHLSSVNAGIQKWISFADIFGRNFERICRAGRQSGDDLWSIL